MTAARDLAPVLALSRRLADADPATLANFAWFAARRGALRPALEAARRGAARPGAPAAAHRAVERLTAGRTDGLTLSPVAAHVDPVAAAIPAVRHPSSTAQRLEAGRAELAEGALERALATFDQVLMDDPAAMSALFHRGVVLAKLRRYREALQAWETVGRADPDGPLGAMSRRHARSARELATLFQAT